MQYRKIILGGLFVSLVPIGASADNHIVVNDSSKIYDIDEVVVIDQPKENFRLRKQPLSSTSFDATRLLNLNVQDLRQISIFVPSVHDA